MGFLLIFFGPSGVQIQLRMDTDMEPRLDQRWRGLNYKVGLNHFGKHDFETIPHRLERYSNHQTISNLSDLPGTQTKLRHSFEYKFLGPNLIDGFCLVYHRYLHLGKIFLEIHLFQQGRHHRPGFTSVYVYFAAFPGPADGRRKLLSSGTKLGRGSKKFKAWAKRWNGRNPLGSETKRQKTNTGWIPVEPGSLRWRVWGHQPVKFRPLNWIFPSSF